MYFPSIYCLCCLSAATCDAYISNPDRWRRQAEVRLHFATYAIDLLEQVEDINSDVGLL